MAQQHKKQKANGPETWTINLPFTLSPGKEISLLDGGHQGRIDRWEFSLSDGNNSYTLKVFGLPDRDKAEAFVQRLGGGLLWARVSVQTGIHFDLDLGKVAYSKDAKATARNIFGSGTERLVDGYVCGERASVFPSDKQILRVTGHAGTVTLGIPPDRFMSALEEGACLPNAAQIMENERVRLASELYSHSHFESSLTSRFLSQMTVLEVLSERPQRPQILQDLIEKWACEIHEAQQSSKDPDKDPDEEKSLEEKSLESLMSGLRELKEESITESVRILVRKALKALRDPKASELVGRIGRLYGVRSKLTHGKSVDLGQRPAELQEIVSKTLFAVMKQPSLLAGSKRAS